MKTFLIAFLFFSVATAQTSYTLEIFVNGEPVAWTLLADQQEGEARDDAFTTDRDAVTVLFDGGKLDLNLADWGVFDYAHVLGTEFTKTAADTYTVSATVRHDDKGWNDYADAFEVKGEQAENGLRELLHPHDDEQPFTRSQSDVRASGEVWLEAKTNVVGLGGSKIYLDLSGFSDLDEFSVSYEVVQKED
ncbi:hypothetical protein BH24DEI2_BH24DEI2_00100 [soil metagenome]